MHRRTILSMSSFLGFVAACQTPPSPPASQPASAAQSAPAPARAETDLVTAARQLIFDGRRSGEGYFSKDGTRLIFQSEREADNPFYQIYVVDLETGDIERVSPGIGKTTCSWIHPEGTGYLFASTQDDPDARKKMKAELDFRASGKSRRYSWDYDEHYDLFRKDRKTGAFVNLTKTLGYDAEGSYSPDGKKIAFSSNRRAYDGSMTDADRAAFERDPAYMMDLYIMNADGSDLVRLTKTPGYDGGPFFSPDGQRIVWRRFNPEGDKAEVWTMKLDGSDKRQITRLGHMSWAPYFHPSGDYMIFNTNVHGFNNFELYIVDAQGAKKPVRVTFTPGWDGLPVFSPDGNKLVWSTGRTADKKAQLFMADWNDKEARRLLALAPGRDDVAYTASAQVDAELGETVPAVVAADVKRHVEALTSPAMGGRLTGTDGEAAATAYVASVFKQLGLQPAGSDGFYQPFEFTSGVSLGEPNVLIVEADGQTVRPKVNEQWRPLAFSKPGSIGRRELVFAGYGVVAPAAEGQPAYDAYEGLDVKDKWAVVFRYLPQNITPARRQYLSHYGSLRYKAMEARDQGAKGLIVVTGPTAVVKEQLVPLRFDAAIAGTGITAVSISDKMASDIFRRAKKDLEQAQKNLDDGKAKPGFALPGTKFGGHLTLKVEKSTGRNVLARLQVGAKPSAQAVVVGAHVDHLGRGDAGDSLAKPEERGQIHPGADDNASGVAGMLEIAQRLADRAGSGKLSSAQRDFVFAAWSGEELGLYGSTHWVNDALEKVGAPKAGSDPTLAPRVAAYLNMDMIGRMDKQVVLQGVASSDVWRPAIEQRNVVVGLPLKLVDDTYLPTDATAFYLRGVPILSAFTGAHSDYHSPRDTADRLNYDGTARVAKLIGLLAADVSQRKAAPSYVKVAPPKNRGNRRTSRVYLGTIPEYAAGDVKGVKLSGVSNEGPAQKAGIKAGDIMVELAGIKLGNIYDYVKALDNLKVGEATTVVVLRLGERVKMPITPGSRD